MIQTTLLACPFCGSTNVRPDQEKEPSTRWIACQSCGALGPAGNGLMDAVVKWNRRPYEAQIQEAIKAAEVDAAARQLFARNHDEE